MSFAEGFDLVLVGPATLSLVFFSPAAFETFLSAGVLSKLLLLLFFVLFLKGGVGELSLSVAELCSSPFDIGGEILFEPPSTVSLFNGLASDLLGDGLTLL